MNWSNVNKSILAFSLCAVITLLWIVWWLLWATLPDFQVWINFDFYPNLITVYVLSLVGYLILIVIAYLLRKNLFVEKYIPYFTTCYLGITLIYGAYCTGIISFASIAGFVSLVTVGLVLFQPREVYTAVIPITFFILIAGYLSATDQIAYAPIYSQKLQELPLHNNVFWVSSMLYFYIPIFLISIILFIILLIQWKYREEYVDKMSKIDPLTLVYNRRSITDFLSLNHEKKQDYVIVLLDIDHFKQVNDTYGHDIGDRVLIKVAQILMENIRKNDYVGRFGGEEFIFILNDLELEQAFEIAERCRAEIEKNHICLNNVDNIRVTASFGVSMPSEFTGDLTKEMFIRQADQALYFAKLSGRNQVRQFAELN
ncbi:GGDEF domain-containing protein [Acinetobacter rongchengensis]|nr:GGDEF domain-containing protein [Acinetobacter rongchengensis]